MLLSSGISVLNYNSVCRYKKMVNGEIKNNEESSSSSSDGQITGGKYVIIDDDCEDQI